MRITAEGVALNELLPMLTDKTGVVLQADQLTGDDKAVILGPARPLRDVMADIAELYNDGWAVDTDSKTGKPRYILSRDLRARQYEENLAAASDRALLAQMQELVRALDETPEQLAARPQGDPIRKSLSNESGRNAAGIFALLSEQQMEQLIQCWQVKLPITALSEKQKDSIADMFYGTRFAPEKNGGFKLDEIPRDQMDKHELRFNILNSGGEYRKTGYTAVYLTAPVGFNTEVAELGTGAKFPLPAHGNPYTGQKVPSTAILPSVESANEAAGQTGWVDRLVALADKSGAPIVADYYRSRPIMVAPEAESTAPETPRIGALDSLCRPQGYLWWQHGGTLLLRKRDWYNQQMYEIPDRWLGTLSAQLRAHNGKPMYADALSLLDLSMYQLIGLMESLGRPTDRVQLLGLHEALACAAGSPGDKTRPFFAGVRQNHETLVESSIMPNL
ncbi:MAG TPA: hypothetical protein VKU60_18890, partial [Chloroflexota bacterium]|nr:hypothetical protein [Chloroflexota bacterium]